MSTSPYLCITDRQVFRGTSTCPVCGSAMQVMSSKWRAPRKNDDRAWKRIAAGEIWWDRSAIAAKGRAITSGRAQISAILARRQVLDQVGLVEEPSRKAKDDRFLRVWS